MKSIIVVEDEFRIREGLCKLISRLDMGIKVVGEADNGIEGLKLIQDVEPDFVITDIKMPRMGGLEMIEHAIQMHMRTRFVILSGYAEFSYAQKAIQLGVTEYLLKPVTISGVKKLLTRLNPPSEPDRKNENSYSGLVGAMVDSIEKNYASHLSIASFASEYKMTPQYISTMFTKETGRTFSAFVRQVRIEKAKELLLTTNMKIYEVAVAVGYPEQKYFSRVFKEYTGVSAKQFARQAQSQALKRKTEGRD